MAGYKRVEEGKRNERRHETRKKLNGWREAYKCAFLNKTVYFGHRLCGGEWERDKRGEKVSGALGESVKNRQLHRQKQDAENIFYLFKGKVREKAGGQSEKRPLVLTEAINCQAVH